MARMLDMELLGQLEQRLRDRRTTAASTLEPGLSDEEIDRTAAPLGFPIPEEVRRWYQWHNGSSGYDLVLSRVFTPLAADVSWTLEMQQDDNFGPRWLKVMNEQPTFVVFDCSGAEHLPVPVWHYDYHLPQPTGPVFASIGDLVTFWIELIDDGSIVWDPRDQLWRESASLSGEIIGKIRGVPRGGVSRG